MVIYACRQQENYHCSDVVLISWEYHAQSHYFGHRAIVCSILAVFSIFGHRAFRYADYRLWHERTAEGFTARAFCHEIDHLDGHLYTELVTEYLDPSDFADDDDDYEGDEE